VMMETPSTKMDAPQPAPSTLALNVEAVAPACVTIVLKSIKMELISDGTAVTMVTQPLVMDVTSMEELNQDTHATKDAQTDQIDAGLHVVMALEYDPKDEMTVILQTEMGAVMDA
jgi:hypothetical protein